LQLKAGVEHSSEFRITHGLCQFGFNNLSGCLFLLDHYRLKPGVSTAKRARGS
jgi:hypothetical protein